MSSKKRKGISGKSDTAPLRVGGGGGVGLAGLKPPTLSKTFFFGVFSNIFEKKT